MKLYCLFSNANVAKLRTPDSVAEVIVHATPDELRKIADFLLTEARLMEVRGADYSHGHLSDRDPELASEQNIIVAPPRK